VAVKTIKRGDLRAASREVAICGQLPRHRNIVGLHGVFKDTKAVHLVLDLCDGGDLFSRIAGSTSSTALSELDTRDVMRSLLAALVHCHKHGVVHRDIKPENIGFTTSDQEAPVLKLLDFGDACQFAGQHSEPRSGLTISYAAPERLSGGRALGGACDLWSAGLVFYTCIAGENPFESADEDGVLRAIDSGLKVEDLLVSAAAKGLLGRLVCVDPSKRLSAAGALAHSWFTGAT